MFELYAHKSLLAIREREPLVGGPWPETQDRPARYSRKYCCKSQIWNGIDDNIKQNYDRGLWNAAMVGIAVKKGIITTEQFKKIIGRAY